MRKLNICFGVIFLLILVAIYFTDYSDYDIERQPWHMKPWNSVDSLSVGYKTDFAVLEDSLDIRSLYDSSAMVIVLVDAWGLPLDENLLKKDLALFDQIENKKVLIHPRSRNQNKYAEKIELNELTNEGIYLFGGDSLEYGRKDYIPKLGFSQMLFCQNCSDEMMAEKLDSILLANPTQKLIAWTTQSSRDGDREKLHESLAFISKLALNHPERRFVIQGTHRPILGTPETRKRYYAHWVPVVVLN